MATAQEVYETSVASLPEEEQRRLVTLIWQSVNRSPLPLGGYSDEWTEEDIRDLSDSSLRYFDAAYGCEADDEIV